MNSKKEIDFTLQELSRLHNTVLGCMETIPNICENKKDEETAKTALSLALKSRIYENDIEKERLTTTKPYLQVQKEINNSYKCISDKYQEIQIALKTSIDKWIEENKDFPFVNTDYLQVDEGSLYKKTTWDWEVISTVEIPLDYLIPDSDTITKAVKNGVRHIPGIEIFEKTETLMRLKPKEK